MSPARVGAMAPVGSPAPSMARLAAVPRHLRLAALGGVAGPAAFVAAWAIGAAVTRRTYRSVNEAISRLAEIGADTRPLMTTGFVCFGIGVPMYAAALRRALDGPAWAAAVATGVATLAVAAAPLGHSSGIDSLHAAVAGVGYLSLAATPLLAARPLIRRGHHALGRLGIVAGTVAAAALLTSVRSGPPTGLLQRIGLTAGDLWIAASAILIATSRLTPPAAVAVGTDSPPSER